jgi:hypothetical protein
MKQGLTGKPEIQAAQLADTGVLPEQKSYGKWRTDWGPLSEVQFGSQQPGVCSVLLQEGLRTEQGAVLGKGAHHQVQYGLLIEKWVPMSMQVVKRRMEGGQGGTLLKALSFSVEMTPSVLGKTVTAVLGLCRHQKTWRTLLHRTKDG